jgi:hypothetical protein
MNQLCSKNLAAALPEWLKHYYEADEIIKQEIVKISPSTIDRRLSGYKAEVGRRLRTGTKPGSRKDLIGIIILPGEKAYSVLFDSLSQSILL